MRNAAGQRSRMAGGLARLGYESGPLIEKFGCLFAYFLEIGPAPIIRNQRIGLGEPPAVELNPDATPAPAEGSAALGALLRGDLRRQHDHLEIVLARFAAVLEDRHALRLPAMQRSRISSRPAHSGRYPQDVDDLWVDDTDGISGVSGTDESLDDPDELIHPVVGCVAVAQGIDHASADVIA